MGPSVFWIQAQGLAILGDGALEVPAAFFHVVLLVPQEAQAIMRFRAVRLQSESLVTFRDGLVELANTLQRIRQLKARRVVLWVQAYRLMILIDRGFSIAFLSQRVAPLDMFYPRIGVRLRLL